MVDLPHTKERYFINTGACFLIALAAAGITIGHYHNR